MLITWNRSDLVKPVLSEHFSCPEFECHCGCEAQMIDDELINDLELVRGRCGMLYGSGVVKINSGHRCISHNKKIGGSKNSNHTKGIAADIVIRELDELRVGLVSSQLGLRVGLYLKSHFTHVDTDITKPHFIGD